MKNKWALVAAIGISLTLGAALSPSGRYLARQGVGQARLLWSRVPVQEVLASGVLTPQQEERLRLIPEIQEFGRTLGLNPIASYDTVALGFDAPIWNVSASEPLAFRPRTWWFPIVGRIPYLGFFHEGEARAAAKALDAQGYETWVRTAGAYSTLGWFRDPVLPPMLSWSEVRLADTLLHELTHATVWCRGEPQFNESLAQFVGSKASFQWLELRHGAASGEVLRARVEAADRALIREATHQLFRDLDAVYRDPKRTNAQKREAKAALYAALPDRLGALPHSDPERLRAWARRETWNNARLLQFRVYNRGQDAFEALYQDSNQDWKVFLRGAEDLCGERKPLHALEARYPDVARVGTDVQDF